MPGYTIKQYAIKHKMSIYQVVKLVASGKLKTQTKKVHGKETAYILEEEPRASKEQPSDRPKDEKELEARVARLEEEVATLKRTIDKLSRS